MKKNEFNQCYSKLENELEKHNAGKIEETTIFKIQLDTYMNSRQIALYSECPIWSLEDVKTCEEMITTSGFPLGFLSVNENSEIYYFTNLIVEE